MLYIKKIFKYLPACINKFTVTWVRYVKTYRRSFDEELMNHDHWIEMKFEKQKLKAKYNQEVDQIFFEETF